MFQVPHHLRRLASILKNPWISISAHYPHLSERSNFSKSLASNRVPKAHKRNNHHVANTPWSNKHMLFKLVSLDWVPPRSICDLVTISYRGLGSSIKGKSYG